MTPPWLVARDLVAGYDRALPIVHGASVQLQRGEVLVLLGPNGAGKSTLAKALAGACAVYGGSVSLDGIDVTGWPSHRRVAAGIGFVPQTANLFTTMTVDENLRVGAHLLGAAERRRRIDEAYARFPDLVLQRRLLGRQLSGGQRQMLAIARALMTAPRLLMLDEPSAGLAPRIVDDVFRQVRAIADGGVAVLLVEQNVRAGLAIADRGLVLVQGEVVHEGAAAALRDDPLLARLFLGGAAAQVPP